MSGEQNKLEVINLFTERSSRLADLPGQFIGISFGNQTSEILEVPSHHLQFHAVQPFAKSPVQTAKLTGSQLLTNGEDIKPVYEIVLESSEKVPYVPGDTIGILVTNQKDEVQMVLEKFGYQDISHLPFKIHSNNPKKKVPNYLPEICTIKRTLSECVDLRSVPKKLFLKSLQVYTTDPLENQYLHELSYTKYSSFVSSGNGTFLHLVQRLSSCRPPFEVLLQHLPRLLPRPYSLCTNPEADGNTLKIIFSVEKTGLATNMLIDKIQSDDSIDIYFRQETNFKYSQTELTRDIVLIGPGTGLAPFISFLSYREMNLHVAGKAWIFTGARYSERNNLFTHFRNKFNKLNITEAFSRDAGSKFRYVQDQLVENKNELVELILNDNTIIYVCGEGKIMLPGIEKSIAKCLTDQLLISEDEAFSRIKCLKENKMYLEDVWI